MKLPKTVIRTAPMKHVPVPKTPKTASPLPPSAKVEDAIAALQARVQELEDRLAIQESMVTQQGLDIVINSAGSVLISAAATVEVTGSQVQTNAGLVETSTAFAKVTGVFQSDTVLCDSIIAASYSPGAGNLY